MRIRPPTQNRDTIISSIWLIVSANRLVFNQLLNISTIKGHFKDLGLGLQSWQYLVLAVLDSEQPAPKTASSA